MEKKLVRCGSSLRDHTDWVTAIAAPINNSDKIVTSSHDRSIISWDLTQKSSNCMNGHKLSVEDVVISSDGEFALSSSEDHQLRLWDLKTSTTARYFLGHTDGVQSGAISVDNSQIASGSADKTIKLWDTRGNCTHTFLSAHSDLVSCVRFILNTPQPTIVSGSWDGKLRVWDLTKCKLRSTLDGHAGHVNTVIVSPDGATCVSGGSDGKIFLWNLSDGERILSLEARCSSIHSLCFKPNTYWLCAATNTGIMIWDKTQVLVNHKDKGCTSVNWREDTLYCGYTDGVVRGWCVE